MKDTARVLGRIFDGIEYRGFGQEIVEELAPVRGVPVWNGLTDQFHPTQILADFLTMQEHSDKPLHDISYCYFGDARNNMGDSLHGGRREDGDGRPPLRPERLWPRPELVKECEGVAKETGGKVTLTDDPAVGPRASTSCTPMSGFPWAKPTRPGTSASSCSSRTRSTRRW